MLKQVSPLATVRRAFPAAFRRLCVETANLISAIVPVAQPPSGGCVLKLTACQSSTPPLLQPPSGGCVLKLKARIAEWEAKSPAAFRRLCVETYIAIFAANGAVTSRLQAAVC